MAQSFPWRRFWCRRESTFFINDRGFLADPEAEHGNILNPNLTTFDQLQAIPCLALLGEPGMGKSWSLSADVDAYLQQSPDTPTIRLDLRSFSSEDRLYRALFEDDVFARWVESDSDLHLYIDSLDECLLRIDSVAALLADEIPKYPLKRLKLRFGCRTASWPTLLEKALKNGFGEENFAAAELVPLRRADVAQAAALSGIADVDGFLSRVDELKIASFAGKPVTLKMLIDTFQHDGDLPDNGLDLYEKGCSILCEEQNESRRAARRLGFLSPKDRVAVASRIAAATQFGNRFAVWTGTEVAGVPEEDVPLTNLIGGSEPSADTVNVSTDAVLETLGTGLFSSRGPERLGWSHQTFAEYLDVAWSESLGLVLLEKLRQNDLAPGIQGEILYKLIDRNIPHAKEWAEETIRDKHGDERGLALSKALLMASDDAGWSTLWPIILEDVEFGSTFLEGVSYGQPDRASFTSSLSDAQLGEFYMWLLEQYPPDDLPVSGAMGPTDTIRFLRDSTLEQLKKRATFEACDTLARAELRFPQHRWLRYHFDEAELLACASTWEAQTPQDIIAMAADAKKRFVESSDHLLNVVLESISRVQVDLHGELASIGDLWNSRDKDWWPKQEEDISDYVARHLKKDLADRRIIINREVQIRRGRRGEMPGQNTDIHVDAIPEEGTKAELYGPIKLVIEVKGSWNDGLMTDMEVQLRDRYMKNSECRTGLYIAAYFKAARWISSDRRRAKSDARDIHELRRQLSEQAEALSGGMLIQSFILDCSLDSTAAMDADDDPEREQRQSSRS